MQNNAQIADTIQQQLGGHRFTAMTGARNFSYSSDSTKGNLSFHLPNARAARGIKYVRITLEATDTYTVEFLNSRLHVKASHTDVHAEQLRSVFESVTGLRTSL